MPDEALPIRVVEVAIDPKWRLVQVMIDDAMHTVLRIEHPQHGHLDLLMPQQSLMSLRMTLEELEKQGETWGRQTG